MIVSKIQGGLGNQIFQWAYGLNLSVINNTPLYLDISFYYNQLGSTKREFSLNKFPNLEFSFFNDKNTNLKIINDDLNFKKLDYDSNFDYYLNGYWASERYFEESKSKIKKLLSFDSNFINKLNTSPYRDVFDKNIVSMHIRRTDYLTSGGFHALQTVDFYKSAIEILNDYDSIYVFSDDINWCKENLKFKNILFVEGLDDIEDMWLMSLCKNNIISNSTFSWWAAWLNNNDNKKVIYPNKWYGDNINISIENLISKKWIKI
jgi:hypothetical protein